MSIDMSQFYQAFFEETDEHLRSMESLLLAIDLSSPEPDELNSIFRAAHSIKGGSGTFGFTDLTVVTHILETLLDRIRKNEVAITAEMVDAFLRAVDVLREILEAHQSGNIADEAASLEICGELERLAADKSPGETNLRVSAQAIYQIRFVTSSDALLSEKNLHSLLENLSRVGIISNQEILANEVTLTLTTAATETELQEIFSYFLTPEQLTITLAETSTSGAAQARLSGGHTVGSMQANSPITEPTQGYGFFEEPARDHAKLEEKQGYGLFVEPQAIKSGIESAQGFGFFVEVEDKANSAMQESSAQRNENPGRRTTDKTSAPILGESSIRVSVGKVDTMVNQVGELVITQAMLVEIISKMDQAANENLTIALAQLERNTRDLQESVMSVRMMPISLVFSRFQRVVRDTASKLNKKVQLKIVGEGTELDKGLIEKLSDPLTHLVRNSLDHGIETPEARIAKGKDPQGTITLRAAHQGGSIVIEVSDDGAGLNRERILAKAKEKGLPVSDSISDAEVWQIIFAPGFSTAAVITDVSGRGVGMDVVKKNIESIGGRVEIASQHGLGSTISIRLPLTLAILDGLSISVGDQIYILPLSFITESLQPLQADIKEISGQGQVVQVRGEYLPLMALHSVFNIQPRYLNPTQGILVLLEAEGRKVALQVDELIGQHQVVIKSLETNYRKVAGVSGATIMGDGRVALILDAGALVKMMKQ